MQCWHAVRMVVEYTVKGSIHAIVDIVHDSLLIGPLVFLWRKIISKLQLLQVHCHKTFLSQGSYHRRQSPHP